MREVVGLLTFSAWKPQFKWVVLFMVLVVSSALLAQIYGDARDLLQLLGDGIETEGIVTALDDGEDDDDSFNWVHYEFDAGMGDPVRLMAGSDNVSRSVFNQLSVADPVTVTFLFNEPSVNSIDPGGDYTSILGLLVCSGFIMFVVVALTLFNGMIALAHLARG